MFSESIKVFVLSHTIPHIWPKVSHQISHWTLHLTSNSRTEIPILLFQGPTLCGPCKNWPSAMLWQQTHTGVLILAMWVLTKRGPRNSLTPAASTGSLYCPEWLKIPPVTASVCDFFPFTHRHQTKVECTVDVCTLGAYPCRSARCPWWWWGQGPAAFQQWTCPALWWPTSHWSSSPMSEALDAQIKHSKM